VVGFKHKKTLIQILIIFLTDFIAAQVLNLNCLHHNFFCGWCVKTTKFSREGAWQQHSAINDVMQKLNKQIVQHLILLFFLTVNSCKNIFLCFVVVVVVLQTKTLLLCEQNLHLN
jgi:hypothetical protein